LTNYDEQIRKFGRSRGKLVYHFLSTKTYADKESVDSVITSDLEHILGVQEEYSAFNLIVYNVHSNRAFYINSKQNLTKPLLLKESFNYGLCNIDIDTIWDKTNHGLALYKDTVSNK
jgi:uncharacterized protein with NRDE domain